MTKPGARAPFRQLPALDGLRAIAVLAVICFHISRHLLSGGYLGVDVFFVISGFLITGILLREYDGRGSFSFANFYARRALRLFPALAAVLVTTVIVALVSISTVETREAMYGVPWVIFYAGNWVRAFGGPFTLGLLGHTWSLSIEEQFYVVWPAILMLILSCVRSRYRIAAALACVAAMDALYCVFAWQHGWSAARISNGTDTHADGLLLGCALAFYLAVHGDSVAEGAARRIQAAAVAGVAAVFILMVAAGESAGWLVLAFPIVATASAALIWSLVVYPVAIFQTFLNLAVLQWIGKRSYGLYLWHFVILRAPTFSALQRPERDVIQLGVIFAAAALSYHFLEQPFLRLKTRFQKGEVRLGGKHQADDVAGHA